MKIRRRAELVGSLGGDRRGLDDVLEEARREPKQTRIRFRSPIAAYGEDAVEPIRAWLTHPELGAFAVRVLEEVARAGSRTAVTALQWGRSGASDTITRDIDEALDRLGVRRGMSKGIESTAELHRAEEPSGSRVWLLRMVPVGEDRVGEARAAGVITIGWGKADGLTDRGLSRDRFRDEVVRAYYSGASDLRAAGSATGQLWRFIREMSAGDLVVVPRGDQVHFARITSDVSHDANGTSEHWAFSRHVDWLTGPYGIPRAALPDEVLHTLRWQGTCLEISAHRRAIMDAVPETR